MFVAECAGLARDGNSAIEATSVLAGLTSREASDLGK